MAGVQIRDQQGNPIQLTDEFGNPVKLTDEHGNPIHLTGVATTVTPSSTVGSGFGTYGTGAFGGGATTTTTTTVADLLSSEPARQPVHHTDRAPATGGLRRSNSSSSSSSSEDDGEGGRRKKKKNGVKDKIKEKLPGVGGGNNKEHDSKTSGVPGGAHTHTAATATHPPAEASDHHQKKGILDKIKDKLPGHHHTH